MWPTFQQYRILSDVFLPTCHFLILKGSVIKTEATQRTSACFILHLHHKMSSACVDTLRDVMIWAGRQYRLYQKMGDNTGCTKRCRVHSKGILSGRIINLLTVAVCQKRMKGTLSGRIINLLTVAIGQKRMKGLYICRETASIIFCMQNKIL